MGDRIARRWAVERELGRAPGRVTLLGQPRSGPPVVVHLLPGDLLADPALTRRLRRETRQLKRLRHPNVARVMASGAYHGQPYVVRQYFPAATLAEQIALGPMSLREAASITTALAGALDAVHARGLSHGSIRAENVLFTPTAAPLLADFGLRWLSAPHTLPTPNPERDLAALAHLTYEMLTAQRLEPGEMAGAALRACRPDLPPSVSATLGRALAGGPARFLNGAALAAELEAAAATLSARAGAGNGRARRTAAARTTPDAFETLPDWEDAPEDDEHPAEAERRRRRQLVWGVVVAVLGTLLILISMLGRAAPWRRPPTPTPAPAVLESASLPGPTTL